MGRFVDYWSEQERLGIEGIGASDVAEGPICELSLAREETPLTPPTAIAKIDPVSETALTIPEVAKRLKCSDKKVRDLINSGALPHFRVGTLIRVAESVLDKYMRGELEGAKEGER